MLIVFVLLAAILLFFFLGFVDSHWIAPAVLFVVVVPLIVEGLWAATALYIFGALSACLAFFYISFALGKFFSPGDHPRASI